MSTAPLTPQKPLPPNVDRASQLLACFWVPFPFTVLLLTCRFYVRAIRHTTGIDDWLMLLGWTFYAIALGFESALVKRGSTRHIVYISPSHQTWITKIFNH